MDGIQNNIFYKSTEKLVHNRGLMYRKIIELANTEKQDAKQAFIEIMRWFREDDYGEYSSGGAKWAVKEIKKQYQDDPYRFIHEFIQNIDDCNYSNNKNPYLNIKVRKKYIAFEYNEDGFEVSDIISLCSFGKSGKQTKKVFESNSKNIFFNTKTGEKGIGFKAVFGVANRVYIESNGYKFYFNSDKPTVPIWFNSINNELGIENEFNEIQNGTRIVLTQIEESFQLSNVVQNIRKYLSTNINSNILLFTNNLKEIVLENEKFSLVDKELIQYDHVLSLDNTVEIIDGIENNGALYNYAILYSELNINNTTLPLLKIIKTIIMDSEIVKSRFYNPENIMDYYAQTRNISIVIDISGEQCGCVYTTLPLKHSLDIPISINAPFVLSTNRTTIEEKNEWNKQLLHLIFSDGGLLEYAFIRLREEKNIDITKYVLTHDISINEYNLHNIICNYPIFEKFDTKKDAREWISLNQLLCISEVGYKFPEPVTLAQCIKNTKVLADKRYIDKINKIYNEDLKKNFTEVVNKYLDCTNDRIEDLNHQFIKDELYRYIQDNIDDFDLEDIKKLKIFRHEDISIENEGNTVIKSNWGEIEENVMWIDDTHINKFIGKKGFDRYRLLSTSYLSYDKHNKIIELLKCSNYDQFIRDLEDRCEKLKSIDECVDMMAVLLYYDINNLRICYLNQYCISERLDCKENLFRKYKVIDEISDEDVEYLSKFTDQPINEITEFIKKCGLRKNNDFFRKTTDFIEIDDTTKQLLHEANEDLEIIETIYKTYNELYLREPIPLKFSYDKEMSHTVKRYIIENKIIKGDILNSFCKECIEDKDNWSDSLLIFLALEKVGKNILSDKSQSIRMELSKALELTVDGDNENSIINKVMRENDLMDFQIVGLTDNKKYENPDFSEAIAQFYKQNNNIFKKRDYFIGKLGSILYLYDSKSVIFNENNIDEALLKYVNDTSAKSEIKNYIEFVTKKRKFENSNISEIKDYKRFIMDLADFRILNYKTSPIDIGRIIEQLNKTKGNPERYVIYELLQNINDARRNYKGKDFDKDNKELPSVEFRFENENKMYIKYFERGFSTKDVYNITSISSESKTDQETGEKGIGFKTVFCMFDKVEIHSNNFHFELSDSYDDKKPKIIVPYWIDGEYANKQNENQTEMIFTLKQGKNFDNINKQLKDMELFIFLKHIDTIKINDETINIREKITDSYWFYEEILSDLYEQFTLDIMKGRSKWINKTENELRNIRDNLSISICLPKDIIESTSGRIYATLPTEEKIGAPIYIDAPFELTTGRDEILEESEYNKRLFEIVFGNSEQVECIFKKAMEVFAKEKKEYLVIYMNHIDNRYVCSEVLNSIRFLEAYGYKELVAIREAVTITETLHQLISIDPKTYTKYVENTIFETYKDQYKLINCHNDILNDLYNFARNKCEGDDELHPIGCDSDILKGIIKNIYNERGTTFNDNSQLHKLLKDRVWSEIKFDIKAFYDIPIFPYKIENGTKLDIFEIGKWYEIKQTETVNKYSKYVSSESYKILDKSIFIQGVYFEDDIHEFNEEIVINVLKNEMNEIIRYSDEWWDKLYDIYQIRENYDSGRE